MGRRKTIKRAPRRLPTGYVSLERRIWTEDMRGDMPLMIIWATMIAWANPFDGTEWIGGQEILLKRGQLVTGLDELADEFSISICTVRRCLLRLERDKRISMQTSNHGRLITVIKYDDYQSADGRRARKSASEKTSNQQAISKQLASNQQHSNHSNQDNPGNQEHNSGDLPRGEAPPHLADVPHPAETIDPDPVKKKAEPKKVPRPVAVVDKVPGGKSGATLKAYLDALELMHGVRLPAEASLRSMACTFVDRVGVEAAPEVAESYVTHEREAWIVKARHPFGELLKNWQKYYTNWQTGTKVTGSMAKAVERNDANHNALERLLAREQAQATAVGGQYKT